MPSASAAASPFTLITPGHQSVQPGVLWMAS